MAAFWPSNATVETRLLTFFYSVVSTKKTIHEAYQTTPENQGIVVFRCGRLWDDDTLIERTRNAPWRWHYHLMLTKTSHLFCCAAASPSTKTSVVYSACLMNLSWLWRCCHIFLHLRRTIGALLYDSFSSIVATLLFIRFLRFFSSPVCMFGCESTCSACEISVRCRFSYLVRFSA